VLLRLLFPLLLLLLLLSLLLLLLLLLPLLLLLLFLLLLYLMLLLLLLQLLLWWWLLHSHARWQEMCLAAPVFVLPSRLKRQRQPFSTRPRTTRQLGAG